MFKLKYNILALLQVIVSLLTSILLLKVFGVSYQADIYLMAISISSAIFLLQLMFVEQFLYFYNDAKAVGRLFSQQFYNFAFFFSLFMGVVSFLLFYLFQDTILSIFVYAMNPERRELLSEGLVILMGGMVFSLALQINIKLLNAEEYFSVPYILEMLTGVTTLATLIYMAIFEVYNIETLFIVRFFSLFFALVVSVIIVIKKVNIPLFFVFQHPLGSQFIKNSISMRFGHNIHNFLFTPITTNILAALPEGNAAIYYYAQKLVQTIYSVTAGPSHKILVSRISKLYTENNFSQMKSYVLKYIKVSLPLFTVLVLLTYVLIPYIIPYITSNLSVLNILLIQELFVFLSFWYLVMVFESSITPIGLASKKSKIFIFTNIVFISIYFSVSSLVQKEYGLYAIPFAAIVAQLSNLLFYTLFIKKILKAKSVKIN